MRRAERLRRWIARADVQTAGTTGAALLAAVLVFGSFLYTFAASESLEELDRWFEFVLQVVVRSVEERGSDPIALEEVRGRLPDLNAAVRVTSPRGELLYERGHWPEPEHQIRAFSVDHGTRDRSFRSAWRVRRDTWMVGERVTAAGERVALALPLRHAASESSEIRRRMLAATAITAGSVLVIGFLITLRAFWPLRRATAQLRGVDTGSLGLRVPSRGTGDPIDVNAETLNSVLARIDAGFARLRAFSSDVAHELRTPLNRISTVSEVALLAGDERELRTALEAVSSTTDELARVVQALLLLAEIDDERLALQPQRIDLRAWVGQHVEAYAPSFEEIDVKLSFDCGALSVEGDRVLLDRIVANLLDNALAHAPAGSAVEIRCAAREDGVALTVDDAGPGVAEGDRERVFTRFARLERATGAGHGLGLALARAIAELHGGTLRVTRSPFGGARFELWLPNARRQ